MTRVTGVWELAQLNVAAMRAPMDDPSMAGFTMAFDRIARLAERSPDFVWRLPSGHLVIPREDGSEEIANLSVWQSYRSMHTFVYRGPHGRLLLRRYTWFRPTRQPSTALWWVPAGTRPTLEQALVRLRHLRAHGPSPRAFSLTRQFGPEGLPARSQRDSKHHGCC
jgi:hypothetical protein